MIGATGALAAATLSVSGLSGLAAAQRPTVATPTAEAIDATVTGIMGELAIPGALVLVDQPGATVTTKAFGVSDVQTAAPMHPNMHMRIGSVTKTMTATVILQLVDEGVLSLDDTLAALLPDRSDIQHAGTITVRHLLSMRSGIFDLLADESFFGQILSDPARPWTPEELIAIAAQHSADFVPGTDYNYSSTGYILLGMIIVRLTKHSLAEELDQRLFMPLGMSQTSLPSGSDMPAPFARGYSIDPSAGENSPPSSNDGTPLSLDGVPLIDWTTFNASAAWSAGGVVSTIGDLHIWLRALVDGSLLSDTLQRERMTFMPVERDPGEEPFGYGLGLADYGGVSGHDGSILGYHSFVGHIEATGGSVIVLTNLDPAVDRRDSATEIASAIIEGLTATR